MNQKGDSDKDKTQSYSDRLKKRQCTERCPKHPQIFCAMSTDHPGPHQCSQCMGGRI